MRKTARTKVLTLLFVTLILSLANVSAFSQTLIDSFEYSNAEESMMRIDSFLMYLREKPNAKGYFIIYGGKLNKKGEVEAHIKQLPSYLKMRLVDKNRIVITNGGFREKLSWDFWLVDVGEDLPKPEATVESKNVKTKGKFKTKNIFLYYCCE